MNLDLLDKTVLITGASSGIGAAAAQIFAEEGADVILSYHRDEAGALQAAEGVRACGRKARLLQMDLRNAEAIAGAAVQLQADGVKLDILILCAGLNMLTPYQKITPEEWERVIGINLSGSFYAIQAFAPLMHEGGAIVTVASVAAQTGAAHHMHYAAAKAGLVNLTKSAARALAPRLRVNCVAPGITLTPMGEDTIAAMPPDYAQKKLLLQRYATADEMARCIVFVSSPVAGFMTGATMDINGGRELR